MKDKYLYDITEVCDMFKTTSRTLRFYEEKGVIQSTTIGLSSRRQYTEEQIVHIRNVLVLRALGLPVKAILELQQNNIDLKNAVLSRRAEIYSLVDKRNREINLLNEALASIESGEDIFEKDWQHEPSVTAEEKHIVEICSNAIVSGNTEELYNYLSPRMMRYMPRGVYETVRKDTLAPLGEFVSFDSTEVDDKYPNKINQLTKYTELWLKITFIFHGKKIDGLWFSYYDDKSR